MNTRNIPQFDPKRQLATLRPEIDRQIAAVLDSGRYIGGPAVREFEKVFGDYLGVTHGLGCGSGTASLKLALRGLDIGPGDEIITTPLTFIATVGMILECGAKPVFVDIDPATFNMNPDGVAAVITDRTKAILAVHLYGLCVDVARLSEHGIPVIEDVAQATGAMTGGKRAGSCGVVGCFSFYPTKNLGGYGEGGFVATNDATLADRCRKLLQHGMMDGVNAEIPGFNSRFDTLQAAILLAKLPHLDTWNARRRAIARLYTEQLAGLAVQTPVDNGAHSHVYHQYVIRCEQREALSTFLAEHGVGTAQHYRRVAYLQDGYRFLDVPAGHCPLAEQATQDTLCLPMYPELEDDEVTYVAEQIQNFFKT